MGKQLSKVGNLQIYLLDFQEALILLIFHHNIRSCLGACFLPPDLIFFIQVRLIYILGYALNFFQNIIISIARYSIFGKIIECQQNPASKTFDYAQ